MSDKTYKYAYQKMMAENNIQESQLTEEAKVGIDNLKSIENVTKALEAKGAKPTAKTLSKIKAYDKWICNELADIIEGTDDNSSKPPVDPEDVIDELEDQADDQNDDGANDDDGAAASGADGAGDDAEKQLGLKIEAELKKMEESGKTSWNIEELKPIAKTVYNELFEIYEDDAQNGITTSNYKLLETDKENKIFTLSKN